MSRAASWWLFGPAAGWLGVAAVGVATTALSSQDWEPPPQRGAVVGSGDCARCHPEQFETWHASYHRTMTQSVRAQPQGVLAPFAGEQLRVAGFVATMDRRADGLPQVTVQTDAPDAQTVLEATVELTVGSHRYQQYVARIDRGGGPQERWRLPFAWHPDAQRWIHLGGAFLFPDVPTGDTSAYLRHFSRWNDNCVFCHNTEPSPGLQPDGEFDTRVGELGIGCEACHGPGESHVTRQSDPFRRVLAGLARPPGDPAVTHPGRLSPERHSEVCGRCHGQRIGHDLADVLAHGDGFVPGASLSAVSRPIFADARLARDPPHARPFADRFWPDGTPRLSAYEYQGLLLSPCYDQGRGLSCNSCHTMHGETPAMQLRPGAQTDAACLGSCHDTESLSSGPAHGGHESISCQSCHMPRTTYGLLRGMASHRITSPDPGGWVGRDDAPDACTSCHVDRSRTWAAGAMARLGLRGTLAQRPPRLGSQTERDLLGGDPVQRALAAHALGRPAAVGDPTRRMQVLVDGLEDDYPAVRWFAAEALQALLAGHEPHLEEVAASFDFMADPAERIGVVDALRAGLGASVFAQHPEVLAGLQAQRDDQAISIGE